MRMWLLLAALAGSISSTPVLAQSECCQCGPSACGPAVAQGDCSGCVLVSNATCNGDSGLCVPAPLEGAQPALAVAPALDGSPLALLAAALVVFGFSALTRRQRRGG